MDKLWRALSGDYSVQNSDEASEIASQFRGASLRWTTRIKGFAICFGLGFVLSILAFISTMDIQDQGQESMAQAAVIEQLRPLIISGQELLAIEQRPQTNDILGEYIEKRSEKAAGNHTEHERAWMLTAFMLMACVVLVTKYRRQKADEEARKLEAKCKRLGLKPMLTPPRMPLIGHLHLMRDYPQNPWDGFNAIREQFGNIVSLQMGVHKMVLISSIEYMNEALIRKGDTFADRPNFPRHHIVFGGDKENSLALCNWSETHRARRKFCKRGVVPNKLSARNQLLESIIKQTVNKFVSRLRAQGGTGGSRPKAATATLTTATAGAVATKAVKIKTTTTFTTATTNTNTTTTTGTSAVVRMTKRNLLFLTGDVFMKFLCDEEMAHEDPAYERFNLGCDFIFYDINQCYLLDFLPYLTRLGLGYFYLRQLKSVTDYCRFYIDDNIFEPRRARHISRRLAAGRDFHDDGDDPETSLGGSLISHDSNASVEGPGAPGLEPARAPREDDYLDSIIREQISGTTSMSLEDYKVGFADLLAGHAAVANILMRLLGHLSLDPEMQDLICDEAERAQVASLGQTPPLPVTEAALMEAMRLASSPIVPHVAREDTSLGDYFVPKGSAVLFNCYNINLSPELWRAPRQFDPRRFLVSSRNEQQEVSHRLCLPKYFMPFSVGQRQCLGYKMVETISVMATANICARFRIRPNNERLVRKLLDPKGSIALSPLEECYEFELEPR